MTKSFLINTSVAAIVSAFVFTAGVSSASARGDNDQYGHDAIDQTNREAFEENWQIIKAGPRRC